MNARQKWLQLFLEILAYEFDHGGDGELLSEGADRLIRKHPVLGRILIIIIGEIIVLHLANVLDERYDLLATSFWRRIK